MIGGRYTPAADPAGSNKKGGEARGRRKRLQVESFHAVIAAAAEDSTRDDDDQKFTVVDFGCGTGNLILPLASVMPDVSFVGVDLNPRSVEILRSRAKDANVRNVTARCGLIEDYDGDCDLALALHVCGGGTDAVLLQAQARNAAFVVAPCCVGKLKDGGMKSVSGLKNDLKAAAAAAAADDELVVNPGNGLGTLRVIHPRSAWMRGAIQRPTYLSIAAAADWSGHQGVDAYALSSEQREEGLGRLPRAAKAAVEVDRVTAAAEVGYGVRVMKMLRDGAGLKNDVIVGFTKARDPLRRRVVGPNAAWRAETSTTTRGPLAEPEPELEPEPEPELDPSRSSRVFFVSDVHTDYDENLAWVENICGESFARDAVVVAGDVSDDLQTLETTLALFTEKFAHVFFTPGNHDLWIRAKSLSRDRTHDDSLKKLAAVLRLCDALGVHTRPKLLGGGGGGKTETETETAPAVWVVPVLSWYHASFDTEPDVGVDVLPPEEVMSDFKRCEWPEDMDPTTEDVAAALDAMNDILGWGTFVDALKRGSDAERNAKLITFSHFLPRLELCPEKRMLFYPNLPKAVGSDYVYRRIRDLAVAGAGDGDASPREHVHLFGHTHFGWDASHEHIRYVQAPISYPHEWRRRPGSLTIGPDARGAMFDRSAAASDATPSDAPLCIWNGAGFSPPMSSRWSDYYKTNAREPDNTELAWWVKENLRGGA